MTGQPAAVTMFTDKHKLPFLIDADDQEAVERYSWSMSKKGYPETSIGKWGSSPRAKPIRLHVFLLGPAPAGLEWDHVNRDKTDNRRSNLRAVTHTKNQQNVGLRSTNRSGVKGVYLYRRTGRWQAQIYVSGRRVRLGSYTTLAAAAAARKAAEEKWWSANPTELEA